ncbi:MAG: hypothetical protein AAB663_01140 [Patescibacteria group bacterium]
MRNRHRREYIMSGGTGSGTVAEEATKGGLPRIVEETDGKTYALTKVWVTFNGMKFVLAYFVDDEGNVLDPVGYDEWCTVEVTDADGVVTYNDSAMDKAPQVHQAWIWERLEKIHEGKAESGPMFEDNLTRVVSKDSGGYALTTAWVLHDGVRYVLLQYIDDDGALVVPNKYHVAVQEGESDNTTYDDDPEYDDRIEDRLDAILAGTAESGPLD